MKILLVDDHGGSRRGIREILEGESCGAEVSEADSLEMLVHLAGSGPWDLVILGVTVAGIRSVEVTSQLRVIQPDLPILFMGMDSGEEYDRMVADAGGCGYLNKQYASSELVELVQGIHKKCTLRG